MAVTPAAGVRLPDPDGYAAAEPVTRPSRYSPVVLPLADTEYRAAIEKVKPLVFGAFDRHNTNNIPVSTPEETLRRLEVIAAQNRQPK